MHIMLRFPVLIRIHATDGVRQVTWTGAGVRNQHVLQSEH